MNKQRLEYLKKRRNICLEQLGDNIASFEYSKERCDRLINESLMLNTWIRELKGLPKESVG